MLSPPLPTLVAWSTTGAFVVIAVLCAASLAHHRGAAPRTTAAEANHVVMAVAMALMVAPGGMALVPATVGTVGFGAATLAWLAVLLELRRRDVALGSPVGLPRCSAHPTHLLLVNAAMTVMYAVMLPTTGAPDGGEHAGHGGGGGTALGLLGPVLALYLLVQAVATLVVLAGRDATPPDPTGTPGTGGVGVLTAPTRRAAQTLAAPATQLVCQSLMGLGMAAMLLLGH